MACRKSSLTRFGGWLALGAVAVVLLAGTREARADFININGPNPGGIESVAGTIPEPILPGQAFLAPLDAFAPFANGAASPALSASSTFTVTGLTSALATGPLVGAADIAVPGGGLPFLTMFTTVTDVAGGSLQVTVDLSQTFDTIVPFLGVAILTATFNEPGAAAPRGDSVSAIVNNVGNQALVSAFDSNGLAQTDLSNLIFYGGGSPDIDANVTFNFSPTAVAGESISIPITFEEAPEPASIAMFVTALLALGTGLRWRRSRKVIE